MRFDIVSLCYSSSRQSRFWKYPMRDRMHSLSLPFTTVKSMHFNVECCQVFLLKYLTPRLITAAIISRNNCRERNTIPDLIMAAAAVSKVAEVREITRIERIGAHSHIRGLGRLTMWHHSPGLLMMFGQDWMTVWTRGRSARGWSARQRPGEPPGWWWRW